MIDILYMPAVAFAIWILFKRLKETIEMVYRKHNEACDYTSSSNDMLWKNFWELERRIALLEARISKEGNK